MIGASVAYGARIQIRTLQRPFLATRYFSALMILEFMLVVPMGSYFYAFYPDWSWMYLIDTSQASTAVGVMAVSAYPIAAWLGYLVGYYSARGQSDWVTVMFIVFMFVGLVVMFFVAKHKLLLVGTYEQYHRDVGLRTLASTSLLPSLLLSTSGLGVCWLYLIYRFVQEGRLSLRALQ
jgi:hypothetical protein